MRSMIHIPTVMQTVFTAAAAVLSDRETDPFDTYYNWGTSVDIQTQLLVKAKSTKVRYPLGWLFRPFDEDIDEMSGYYARLKGLKIFFVMQTEADKTDQQRTALTFTNRLLPFCEEFLKALDNSQYFSTSEMKLKKTEYPYYDGRDGKGANIFPEATDVVLLTINDLLVNETVCSAFKMGAAG